MKSIYSSPIRSQQGFTLLETMVSMSILLVSVVLGMGSFLYMQQNRMEQFTQTELDLDLRLATQRLEKEMRLSALDQMVFFPADAKQYTAVSFPMNDVSSLSKTNGSILWDSTVIYHVSTEESETGTSESKLLRTVLSNRNNALSTADRQLQLDQVVYDGHGENAETDQETSATTCLFEHVFNWEINPQGSLYDGYDARNTVDKTARLGSFNLDAGEHTIRFEVIGKDSRSSGYRIGLDTISFSGSQSIREAEDLAVNGVVLPRVELDQGDFSNYRKLIFDADSSGQSFEVKLYNDRWEDTAFHSNSSDSMLNVTSGFDPDYDTPEITLRLKGATTNEYAASQTGDNTGRIIDNEYFRGAVVRTLIKGAEIQAGATAGIAHEGAGCRLAFYCAYQTDRERMLKIEAAYIDECSSSISATPDTLGTARQLTFNDGNEKCIISGPNPVWTDLLDFPIYPEKNYAVTFSIHDYSDQNIYPKVWESATNIVNSYILSGDAATSAALTDPEWSSNTNRVATPFVVGVGDIYVSYPSSGTFMSAPFDTHMQRPQYEKMNWEEESPAGTALQISVRSATKSDMSDASDWKYIATPGSIGIDFSQYIQYRVDLTASEKGSETPKLKNLAIQWPGATCAADLSGAFINGPDCGQFKTLVDGQELTSPLRINLEVKKDIYGMNHTTKTFISETSFELTPRNSN